MADDLFPVEVLPKVKGKSLASLAYSRQRREELLLMFRGEVPASIMRKQQPSRTLADPVYGSYTKTQGQYLTDEMNETERAAFEISNAGVGSGALSLFPQNIGRAMVLLYSEPEDVVVDPFAGHNSRMDLCVLEGRHYIGYDVSEHFMKDNRARAKFLRELIPNIEIALHESDSRFMIHTQDGFGDFTITSPPYYNIENYGDEPAQLGKLGTYRAFIDDLQLVMQQNYRCLKSGAYAVWFVNDFRRDGKFHQFHVDTIKRMEEVGFVMNDLLVVDLGNSFREAFINQIVEQKILPKRHEFGLIFRKP